MASWKLWVGAAANAASAVFFGIGGSPANWGGVAVCSACAAACAVLAIRGGE